MQRDKLNALLRWIWRWLVCLCTCRSELLGEEQWIDSSSDCMLENGNRRRVDTGSHSWLSAEAQSQVCVTLSPLPRDTAVFILLVQRFTAGHQ